MCSSTGCSLMMVLLAGLFTPLHAQVATTPRNAFYVELGGNALIYSVNLERLVTPHVAVRAGAEVVPDLLSGMGGSPSLAAPLSVSYLVGNSADSLEAGLGVVLGLSGNSSGEIDFTGGASSTLTLGYRRVRGKQIMRLGFTPVFRMQRQPVRRVSFGGQTYTFPASGRRLWQRSFGISIGRTF